MVVTTRRGQRAREAASARQVFETAELLEMILLEAVDSDIRTVLLSQRVNRTFKATIDNSPKLQRALWFRRDPAYFEDACWRINPLFEGTKLGEVTPQRASMKCQHFHIYHGGGYFRDDILNRYIKYYSINCTDDILEASPSPPPNMVLAEHRQGADKAMGGLGISCYLKRVPPKAGKQRISHLSLKLEDQVTFGGMMETIRKKLKRLYGEYYSDV